MNRKTLIVGLSIAAAAASVSAESYTEYNTPFVSTAQRVVVQSQVARGVAPSINPWSTSYNPLAQFRSDRTRAQVSAEYVQAREVVNAFTGEDSGSGYLSGRPAAAGETFASVAAVR
ncbi:MAG: hypothetical protein K0S48_2766 [Ramlibacter sp.]|nr:hypothetical protein [Ramlibacter sp.]